MKKILITISAFFILMIGVNAAGLSVTVNCPESGAASSNVDCTISFAPSSSFTMCSGRLRYEITNASKTSYTAGDIALSNNGTNGVIFDLRGTDCFSTRKSLGTLKIKLPNTAGTATVRFHSLEASDDTGDNMITSSDISKNITIVAPSTVNTLSALSLTGGTLSPTFSENETSYTATVDAATTAISATKSDNKASVTGTGSKNLNYGTNTFNIVVTSESGSKKTYTIVVTRPDNRSTVNTLSALSIKNETISPNFNSNVTNYTATVSTASITINATKTDSKSSVKGDGTKNLNYGANTFQIEVTSEKGTKKTYTLLVTRQDTRDTVNTLNSLYLSIGTLSPSFNTNTLVYTSKVAANINKLTVNASKTSAKSSFVSGYGSREINLEYGVNKILVKVISENLKEKVYTINVTREDNRSANNYLKDLSIDAGKITFKKTQYEYLLTVKYDVEKVNIEAIAEDLKAKLVGTGSYDLKVGINEFPILVTAENTKTRTYKFIVTRLSENESPSENNYLKSLHIAGHDLGFQKEVSTYTIKLNKDEDKLDLTYFTEDEKSVVIVSGNENLVNGSIVSLKVTSSDGKSRYYDIKISKPEEDGNKITKTNTNTKISSKMIISIICILIIAASVIAFVVIYKKRNKQLNN